MTDFYIGSSSESTFPKNTPSCEYCQYYTESPGDYKVDGIYYDGVCNWDLYHQGAVPFWKIYPEKHSVSKNQGWNCRTWLPKLKSTSTSV